MKHTLTAKQTNEHVFIFDLLLCFFFWCWIWFWLPLWRLLLQFPSSLSHFVCAIQLTTFYKSVTAHFL